MNKEKVLERLTALEAEAKTLREILEAPEKKERWRAQTNGGEYFTITQSGLAASMDYNWASDRIKFDNFNYFQVKEAAERIERVQLAYRKLDWAIRQFDICGIREHGFIFYVHPADDFSIEFMAGEADLHYPLPKMRNRKDAEYILSNYKAELLTFLTGGEK